MGILKVKNPTTGLWEQVMGIPASAGISADAGNAIVPGTDGRAFIDEGLIGGGAYEVADWAALLALTGVPNGRRYTVLAPVCTGTGGCVGTVWIKDSGSPSGWRPASQLVFWNGTRFDGISGGSSTEQFFASPRFAAGVLAGARHIRVRGRFEFDAPVDGSARTFRLRIGIDGTSSDTQMILSTAVTNAREHTFSAMVSVASDTTLEPLGLFQVNPGSPDAAASGTAAHPTLTVPGMLASQLYLSLTGQQGATPVATISMTAASIYLE